MSSLETAILNVPGVTDVVFDNVTIRAYNIAFSGATYLVLNNTENLRKSGTFSGYIIPDPTAPHDLATTLTFITP